MTSTSPAAVVVLAAGEGRGCGPRCPRCCTRSPAAACSATRWRPRERSSPSTCSWSSGTAETGRAHLAEVAPAAKPVVQDQQQRHRPRGADRAGRRAGARRDGGGDLRRRAAADRRHAAALLEAHAAEDAAMTVLSRGLADPTGYGRIVRADDGGAVSPSSRRGTPPPSRTAIARSTPASTCSTGSCCAALRNGSTTDNDQGEEYLTDVLGMLGRDGSRSSPSPGRPARGARRQRPGAARRAGRILRDRLVNGVDAGRRHRDRPGDHLARRRRDPRAGTWSSGPTPAARRDRGRPGRSSVRTARYSTPTSARARTVVAHGGQRRRDRAGATVGPYTYLRPGTRLAAQRQGRRVRRDEERRRRRGRQGAAPVVRRRRDDRRAPTSARRRSSSTTTGSRSTAPRSVATRGPAPTTCSWRRSTSATAPTPRPARSSPRTCRPARWGWRAGRQRNIEGWVERRARGDGVRCGCGRRRRGGMWETTTRRPGGRRHEPGADRERHQDDGREDADALLRPGASRARRGGRHGARRRADADDAYDFANGEIFVRFKESVRGCDAFVIQSHAATSTSGSWSS